MAPGCPCGAPYRLAAVCTAESRTLSATEIMKKNGKKKTSPEQGRPKIIHDVSLALNECSVHQPCEATTG